MNLGLSRRSPGALCGIVVAAVALAGCGDSPTEFTAATLCSEYELGVGNGDSKAAAARKLWDEEVANRSGAASDSAVAKLAYYCRQKPSASLNEATIAAVSAGKEQSGSKDHGDAAGTASDSDHDTVAVSKARMRDFCNSSYVEGAANSPNDDGTLRVNSSVFYQSIQASQYPDLISGNEAEVSKLLEASLRHVRDESPIAYSIPDSISNSDIHSLVSSKYIFYYLRQDPTRADEKRAYENGESAPEKTWVPIEPSSKIPLRETDGYGRYTMYEFAKVDADCRRFMR